jgi:hypothetical protein
MTLKKGEAGVIFNDSWLPIPAEGMAQTGGYYPLRTPITFLRLCEVSHQRNVYT